MAAKNSFQNEARRSVEGLEMTARGPPERASAYKRIFGSPRGESDWFAALALRAELCSVWGLVVALVVRDGDLNRHLILRSGSGTAVGALQRDVVGATGQIGVVALRAKLH